jgi:hypothetical protein
MSNNNCEQAAESSSLPEIRVLTDVDTKSVGAGVATTSGTVVKPAHLSPGPIQPDRGILIDRVYRK